MPLQSSSFCFSEIFEIATESSKSFISQYVYGVKELHKKSVQHITTGFFFCLLVSLAAHRFGLVEFWIFRFQFSIFDIKYLLLFSPDSGKNQNKYSKFKTRLVQIDELPRTLMRELQKHAWNWNPTMNFEATCKIGQQPIRLMVWPQKSMVNSAFLHIFAIPSSSR